MTDLNKEREAFEALPQIKGVLIGGDFYFSTLSMNYKPKNPKNEKHVNYTYFLNGAWYAWQEKAKAQAVPEWISAEVGSPVKFGTRVKIKRKSWDEEDNLIYVESEATYDKDSDFCELSNSTYEYETWFDHELNKYLEEDELTHWAPLDKSESGAEG